MACPKGWEALTPLAADDRATHAARTSTGRHAFTRFLGRSDANIRERDSADAGEARPRLRRLPRNRTDAHGRTGIPRARWQSSDWGSRMAMGTRGSAWRPRSRPTNRLFRLRRASLHVRRFRRVRRNRARRFANLCIAHPIMWERVCPQPTCDPEIVVIDPRKTETASAATRHVRSATEIGSHALLRPAHAF